MKKIDEKKAKECNCQECNCESEKISEMALAIDRVEDEKLLLENQLKQALADYHNLLNSSQKREQLRFFQLKKHLAEQIVPSLDSIMLAINSGKDIVLDENGKSWVSGIYGIFDSITKMSLDIGLKQYIPNKGEVFDNQMHEAIAVIEGGEKGKIVDVVQPGYKLEDVVIRPARVVVAK